MKHYKNFIIAFFSIVILGTPWLVSNYPTSARFVDGLFSYVGANYSAAFFEETVTVSELKDKFKDARRGNDKIKIFIMPGHEPDAGGTQFSNLKERDMNVDLAKYLSEFISTDPHYEVVMGRDKASWNTDIASYFDTNWEEIQAFVADSKSEMIRLLSSGRLYKLVDGVQHNDLPKNSALRLYGINKWNNENDTDVAIHIHFNDYPRSNARVAGKYTGFSIYVPEKQYSNSTTTKAIADAVFKRLAKYNPVSNLPDEEAGIVQEQDLIAIGSFNTSDAPSMLIEYGYIYEPQFANESVRHATLRDLAFQTYLGLQDFFGSTNQGLAYDTLLLPYSWSKVISGENSDKDDVLALQSALILEGLYPPDRKTKNECPRTGKFGPCTMSALSNFQGKYGIKGEKNMVGVETQKVLNSLYSSVIR